jgi:predicted CXXCH cytochrome family protein
MGRERNVLAQIIKSWAQDQDNAFQIASSEFGDEGVDATSLSLTSVIKNTESSIDLLSLLDRLELYVLNVKNRKLPDGMFCHNCHNWHQFAEPNQEDGSLLCYSCRLSPYV